VPVSEKESEGPETRQVLQDSLAVGDVKFSSHLMATFKAEWAGRL
jgi:hypothetical protein